jgi:hypothetical protein
LSQIRICFPEHFDLDEGYWRLDLGRPNLVFDVFGPFDRVRSVWGRISRPVAQAEFQEYQERRTITQRTDIKILGISPEQKVLLRLGGLARGSLPLSDLALGSLRRRERCYPFSSREKEKAIALRSCNAVRTQALFMQFY